MTKQELINNIFLKETFLCVGLDSDRKKIPHHLLGGDNPVFDFNRKIIDATAPYCVAYKLNVAFYECDGMDGWKALEDTLRYLHEYYPSHFVIADAKRGDIGNTSAMYARCFYEQLNVDALTVAPYMGEDSVTPFLTYPDKWVVLLALTSNKGSLDFQMTQDADGQRLFEKVIERSRRWAGDEKMMYVVGATRGELIGDVRKKAPNSFFLVPGVGAQGGSLEDVCRYGMTKDCGLLVNSSRGIIFADSTEQFASVAAEKAKELQQQMKAQLALVER